MIVHGSRAGYRACRAGDWGACAACRKAQADYQRARRERLRRRREAEQRARRRLAGAFPDVFEALVQEEMRKTA